MAVDNLQKTAPCLRVAALYCLHIWPCFAQFAAVRAGPGFHTFLMASKVVYK